MNHNYTHDQAVARLTYTKAWNELATIAERINEGWKPDWDDEDQKKYCIEVFTRSGSSIYFAVDYGVDIGFALWGVYFKSKEIAEKALESLSEESKKVLANGYS